MLGVGHCFIVFEFWQQYDRCQPLLFWGLLQQYDWCMALLTIYLICLHLLPAVRLSCLLVICIVEACQSLICYLWSQLFQSTIESVQKQFVCDAVSILNSVILCDICTLSSSMVFQGVLPYRCLFMLFEGVLSYRCLFTLLEDVLPYRCRFVLLEDVLPYRCLFMLLEGVLPYRCRFVILEVVLLQRCLFMLLKGVLPYRCHFVLLEIVAI